MIADLNELDMAIEDLNKIYIGEKGKSDKLKEQLDFNKENIIRIKKETELLDKVIILFQKTSNFAREQAKTQIESLTSKCLQFIFESDIRFKIEIEELRNTANAEFYIITRDNKNDIEIKTKPELSRGGGVVDIVSLALRVAFLEINKPKIEGPLILDEPAKHVSEEYIFNVGEFLKETSEMFNRQIIMVTHNEHLAALGSTSYIVELKDSSSVINYM